MASRGSPERGRRGASLAAGWRLTNRRPQINPRRRDSTVRKRLSNLTRRSLVGALVGLAFAAAAGVGLAQLTAGSTPTVATTITTASQTTSTSTTTGDREGQSADEQES